jgi:uncharacterized protein YaaQ
VRLVLAILQSPDLDGLLRELAQLGVSATQIEGDSATGRTALAGVMVGVEDDQVGDVLALVRATARGRLRRADPLRPIAERAEFWVPVPTEQVAGGASVFVLPVHRFERIGYA